jgi:hypothetical protein
LSAIGAILAGMRATLLLLLLATPSFAAEPVVIDGVINEAEWRDAEKHPLTPSGELLIRHEGDRVFLATRGTKKNIVSVCTAGREEVQILHASAALGTARYRRDGESWKLANGFTFTVRENATAAGRAAFLEKEGWLANPRAESGRDREFEIRLDNNRRRIAVAVLQFEEPMAVAYWPESVADDCKAVRLGQGHTDETQAFAIQSWWKAAR